VTKLISLTQALAILESCDENGVPVPFEIEFCTADQERGTGGEIIRYERAIWHIKNGYKKATPEPVDKRKTGPTAKKFHWTRNIRAVDSDQIRKLNAHLILSINGLSVR
jgi:hypothetical protein